MVVHWKDLDEVILKAIDSLEEKGFKEPTIRSVYYVLGSQNIIPLTDQGYKGLDAKMVQMRKDGKIDWGFFAVKRGTSEEAGVKVQLPHNFTSTVPYCTPEEWAEHWVQGLSRAHTDFHLPRWYNQPNLVEVWVEKDGLLGATCTWIEDFEVTVRAPQGYGAWEFIHESLNHIEEELVKQNKESVHILYLGDLDPSGKDIPRFMEEEAITYFESEFDIDVDFKEIALDPEQVQKYKLPRLPESLEVMAKIRRDPRLNWYRDRYPADMFVELDAFYALATDAARSLIRDEVTRLFDESIYEESRREEEEMKKRVSEAVDRHVTFKEVE